MARPLFVIVGMVALLLFGALMVMSDVPSGSYIAYFNSSNGTVGDANLIWNATVQRFDVNGTAYVNGSHICTVANGLCGGNGTQGPAGANGTNGVNGTNGLNGTGILSIYTLQNGSLQINLTNGTNITTGNLTGARGAQGPQGEAGSQGSQGIPGINGTDGINATANWTLAADIGGAQVVGNAQTVTVNGYGCLVATLQGTRVLNLTVNESCLDARYYLLSNPFGFVNIAQVVEGVGNWSLDKPLYALKTEVESVNATANAKASPGNCSVGSVVQNTTTGGVQCVSPLFSYTEIDPIATPRVNALNATKATTGTCSSGFVVQNATNTTYQCVNRTAEASTAFTLSCTDCLDQTQIQDIYLLNTGDTGTGNYLFSNNVNITQNFTVNGGTLFADSTNNHVGIGTLSPVNALNVLGDVNGTARFIAGDDFYGKNDTSYGVYNRVVTWGTSPDETWNKNADDLTWTGYATYTNFITPQLTGYQLGTYYESQSTVNMTFRYRSADTSNNIKIKARLTPTYLYYAGVMIDDANTTSCTDGNGTRNFYRVYVNQTGLGGPYTAVEEYRTNCGAVVTNVGPSLPYGEFHGIDLWCSGTRWTNWACSPATFSEPQSRVQFTGGSPAFSWTPARVGLYGRQTGIDFGRRAIYDWYDECTTINC